MRPSTRGRPFVAALVTAALLAACGGGAPANAPDPAGLPAADPNQYPATITESTAPAAPSGTTVPSGSMTAAAPSTAPGATATAVPTTAAPPGTTRTTGPAMPPGPTGTSEAPDPGDTASPTTPAPPPARPKVDKSCRQPASHIGSDGVAVRGQRPPDFTATTLDCKRLSYREFTDGRPVVVNFFASWCKPCIEEAPAMQDLYEEWNPKNGLLIVGVDTQDEKGDPSDFYTKYGWTFPSVWDDGNKIVKSWDNKSNALGTLPITFFVKRDGTVHSIVIGGMSREQMQREVEQL